MKMTIGSFIVIQDYTPTNPLFGGSSVYVWCNNISISGKNNLAVGTESMVYAQLSQEEPVDMLERRKGYVAYVGFENPKFSISGTWTPDIGSVQMAEGGQFRPIERQNLYLTPARFWQLVHSDHQFHIRGLDSAMLTSLISPVDGEQLFVDLNKGIPVAIEGWDMKETPDEKKIVRWNINLVEDKDEID